MTHCRQPDIEQLVAASLVRLGTDTRAARLFKEHGLIAHPPREIPGLLADAVESRHQHLQRARAEAGAALRRAETGGIVPIPFGSPDYPELLSQIVDPPIVLWTQGDVAQLKRPAVALVGSRRATPAGLAVANRLGRDLARAGLVVISGLARGIDAAAHRGALEAGGSTVAVLGNGVDVVYPREHRSLREEVVGSGCLVSELPPGTLPLARHFPLRNRLISGLSLGVVIVEAAERSGSLITARMALEQGRDVLAVPGNVVSGCHQGCHALIKDGARLVETVQDVLAEIRWSAPQEAPQAKRETPAEAAIVLAQMKVGEAVSLEELAARTPGPPAVLIARLGELEVEGLVARAAGGTFVRLD